MDCFLFLEDVAGNAGHPAFPPDQSDIPIRTAMTWIKLDVFFDRLVRFLALPRSAPARRPRLASRDGRLLAGIGPDRATAQPGAARPIRGFSAQLRL